MAEVEELEVGRCYRCRGKVVARECENRDWGPDWYLIDKEDLYCDCLLCGEGGKGDYIIHRETKNEN